MGFTIESIFPYLAITGKTLTNLDENKSGADDFAGALLSYVAEVGQAVVDDEELPAIPELVRKGTGDKITGVARASLLIADNLLTFAQFQVSGKARKIFKYAAEALSALLAGETVPTAPSF